MIHRFGPFQLDDAALQLTESGRVVPIPPKALDMLVLLVSQPSTLIPKQVMLARLWPNATVTNNAITQVLSQLRQALGDDRSAPKYVQTVRQRGFRFIGELTPTAAEQRQRTIAVADFRHLTDDAGVAWLSLGVAETISNELRALRDLSVIDRAGLSQAARAGDLEAARTTGLDWLVVGSYQRSGDQLRITARAIIVTTGEAVARAMVDGPVAEAFDLQDRLVRQLLADIQQPRP